LSITTFKEGGFLRWNKKPFGIIAKGLEIVRLTYIKFATNNEKSHNKMISKNHQLKTNLTARLISI